MRAEVEQAIATAIKGQRDAGFSWAAIGRGLGVSRQAAQMAWGRVVDDMYNAELREMLDEHRDRVALR